MEMSPAVSAHGPPAFRRYGLETALLGMVGGLCVLGLLVIFSIGRAQGGAAAFLVFKQMIWMVLGLGAMFVTMQLNFERLRSLTWIVAAVGLLLLGVVLVPGIGREINGAQRWIDLGPMNLQASDFGKIALVFTLAHYLAVQQRYLKELARGFLLPRLSLVHAEATGIRIATPVGNAPSFQFTLQ